ncbi:laccase domain-containing protein [Citricoccus sp. SGAir0253]|uniref:polyphenol oxidase family protein n=1 Tax=Citricoccus sp. SGAir0253 TaxID=2567881 RepID=UPI0010CCD5BF|nr:polyphenol oxidase family protein [Citricoccus sp. SGAir0253]QCU77842.1 laccase domain-containing protein [Citricoccus sp. SGAir0253]
MLNHSATPAGAPVAPAGPFLHHATPAPGLHVAFTGVDAGNLAFHVTGGPGDGNGPAAVAAARRDLEARMGVAPGSTEYLTQVHSARVVTATGHGWADRPGAPEEADAVVSRTGTEPLAIMVADCLPVAFASRPVGARELSGPTAVAHAGRRGLLDGVLEATVHRLREAGAGDAPGDIEAWVGPGICGRCYEVPEEMLRDGAARVPATASRTSWGTPALDLPAGATAVLQGLGVAVHRVDACTLEDERLFSHRREPGRGRFAGLVWRTPERTGEGS